MSKYTFEGKLNFRFTTLDVLCTLDYSADGTFDIVEMSAWSDRRNKMVEVSDKLAEKFGIENTDFLSRECLLDYHERAEYYREQREEYGDWLYHSRKDEALCNKS